MPTNSHIQCSKFIIKQFNICKSNGNVYTLDLTNGSIEERSSNQIGTSIDYYNEFTENLLSTKIEASMGSIL